MREIPTYRATIYIGLKCNLTGEIYSGDEVHAVCQEYCDKVGLCVTVKPTCFRYTGGCENGMEVGLINYPRFPRTKEDIKGLALTLAQQLMTQCDQERCSVVFDDVTVMLEAGIDSPAINP